MVESIGKYFSGLPDPHHPRGRRHRLDELVTIAILAVICGTDSWQEVAQWARAKRKWLKTFMDLPHGPPSHDTLCRVFAALWPEAFEQRFLVWIQTLVKRKPGELTAIDDKTLRHSFDRASAKAAIHMINAWSSANGPISSRCLPADFAFALGGGVCGIAGVNHRRLYLSQCFSCYFDFSGERKMDGSTFADAGQIR